jgi:hypothetical protein
MKKTIITFDSVNTNTYNLYDIIPLTIKIIGNNADNIKFKITSSAFAGKNYNIHTQSYMKEYLQTVIFTCPGEKQEIKLIPIENCIVGHQSTLKINVIGKLKDIRGTTVTPTILQPTVPCNINNLILKKTGEKLRKTEFKITRLPGDRTAFTVLNKLNESKEHIQTELTNTFGQYNSDFYSLKVNKDYTKKHELTVKYRHTEQEILRKQFELENQFTEEENKALAKISSVNLKDSSIIQVTGATDDSIHNKTELDKLTIDLSNNNYFCSNHPKMSTTTYDDHFQITPNTPDIYNDKLVNLNIYQLYKESDYSFFASPGSLPNEIHHTAAQGLKFWRDSQKKPKVYKIKVESCGLPDVIMDERSSPQRELSAEVRVYPSDEYCFYIKSDFMDSFSFSNNMNNIFTPAYQAYQQHSNSCYYKKNVSKEDSATACNYTSFPELSTKNMSFKSNVNNTKASKYVSNINDLYNDYSLSHSEKFLKSTAHYYFRNGKKNELLSSSNTFWKTIYSLITRIKHAYLNLSSISYNGNNSYQLDLEVFKGSFLLKWGIKEYIDNNVFLWKKLSSAINIFNNRMHLSYDSYWGIASLLLKGKTVINGNGDFKYNQSHERTVINDYYRYYTLSGETEVSSAIHMYLDDDTSTYSTDIINSGLSAEVETSFKIQHEERNEAECRMHFKGVKIRMESKVPVFKTYSYEKNVIEEYPGGSEIKKIAIPAISLSPWIDIQSKYETLYGKALYLKNIINEALSNLYYIQYQLLSSRETIKETGMTAYVLSEWTASLIKPSFNLNGSPANSIKINSNSLSEFVMQWSRYLEYMDLSSIPSETSNGRLQLIHKEFSGKTLKYSKISENRNITKNTFEIVLLLARLTDLLESKLKSNKEILLRIKEEISELIQLENDSEVQNSLELYSEIEERLIAKYEIIQNIFTDKIKIGLPFTEIDPAGRIAENIGLPNEFDLSKIEDICRYMPQLRDILKINLTAREYWLNPLKSKSNIKLNMIFESTELNGDNTNE